MRDDTTGRFPTTRLSAVAALAGDDPALRARSFATLAAGYWKPVYKHLRVKWRKPPEDARDATQAFFATALEKGFFRGYDPARARFRTFVRTCLDRFVSKQRRAEKRIKRGGAAVLTSFDWGAAEAEIEAAGPPAPSAIEDYFDREWARHLLATAVEGLRAGCAAKGHLVRFQVFERYELLPEGAPRPSYAGVAAELGIAATDVTNHLSYTRRELRRRVLESLRELTPDEDEYRAEARALLGIDV
jgi:DNA-directed RNA polymerase specialized sigma24 family protein